jgi:hypothetical protein
MTTKPPLQKILQGILHTKDESKQKTQEDGKRKHQTTGEEKTSNHKVALIQLDTIKFLNNKTN